MSKRAKPKAAPAPPPAKEADAPEPADPKTVLERMLARPTGASVPMGGGAMHEATISAWSDNTGTLDSGHIARLGASCLLRPAAGDRALIWSGGDGQSWVLAVLQRPGDDPASVLATPGPLTIEAPKVGITAASVHVSAHELLTSTRNRHAVEETRTETTRVRVAQVGTDIRRATTADDQVTGTFLQRTGTWISNTAREARLRARTFLFE